MSSQLQFEVLFEVTDVFGKRIRTSPRWWKYIVEHKHEEVANKIEKVKETLKNPDFVNQSEKKEHIKLYYKRFIDFWICVVARHLNGDGFLMTTYLTTKNKPKGVNIWQKERMVEK